MLTYVDYTSPEEFKPDASSVTDVLPYDCVKLWAEHPAIHGFPIASLLAERRNSIIIIDPYPLGSNMFYGFKPDPQFAKAPSMDWIEAAEAYFMKVDLPGLKREEVKVEVEQALRMLQISGEPGGGKIGEDKNYILHRMERITGKFHRRFKLPENAKLDLIKASMGNGLLTVTVPKEELKVIEIFDDSLTDQNGTVLRVKSTAEKGKAVLEEEAKDIKCTEISGEKSRRLKTIKIE